MKRVLTLKEGFMWFLKRFDELNINELYEILRVRNEVFVYEQKCLYQDLDYKDQQSYHLFYKENGKVVFYLRIIDKGVSYNEISIGRVLVVKTHRRKGLCRQGMLKSLKFIKNELKETQIRISAQEYLIPFYEEFGFKTTSDLYFEDNLPHYEMFLDKVRV